MISQPIFLRRAVGAALLAYFFTVAAIGPTSAQTGLIVVTSAGNRGMTTRGLPVFGTVTTPGDSPAAITVGALNTWGTAVRLDDTIATCSSHGAAPTPEGQQILWGDSMVGPSRGGGPTRRGRCCSTRPARAAALRRPDRARAPREWDGTGYPDVLRGEQIPIGARILSVVDCFDALTSHRRYLPAMSEEEAVAIIVERRGTMYDPHVVDAFIAVYREIAPPSLPAPQLQRALGRIRQAHAPHLATAVVSARASESAASTALDDQRTRRSRSELRVVARS